MGEMFSTLVCFGTAKEDLTNDWHELLIFDQQFFVYPVLVFVDQSPARFNLVTFVVFLELVESESEDFEGSLEAVEHEEYDQEKEKDRQVSWQVISEHWDDVQVADTLDV